MLNVADSGAAGAGPEACHLDPIHAARPHVTHAHVELVIGRQVGHLDCHGNVPIPRSLC